MKKSKGGENLIKERSHYRVEDKEGNILKKGFKDLHDAHEYAVNKILSGKYDEAH